MNGSKRLESRESDVERKERVAFEILKLLAKICETGPDMDPMKLRALRDQVKQLLQYLGLKGPDDELLQEIIAQAYQKEIRPAVPDGYPSLEEFTQGYRSALEREASVIERECIKDPSLAETIRYATAPWREVKGRQGFEIEKYLHQLGAFLADEKAYGTLFPEDDAIAVDRQWRLQNGRHRVLALKSLGERYVRNLNPFWINTILEKN